MKNNEQCENELKKAIYNNDSNDFESVTISKFEIPTKKLLECFIASRIGKTVDEIKKAVGKWPNKGNAAAALSGIDCLV